MIGQERKALAVGNDILDLSRSKYWLHELIKDCRLFIEPVKPIERVNWLLVVLKNTNFSCLKCIMYQFQFSCMHLLEYSLQI